ncbi:hypothetical protein [Candidatus Nanohalovita haloferacivicina]|uniref:hypothetical protein n=1 Tax=Candidatus Nanohalovita haloferacivicina TaxID=2978046 RepID=UPI00325F96DA|nr:hypothetical protein HBNXNv_0291 [Candidatus Nanohalobia archaeon BNXNv]
MSVEGSTYGEMLENSRIGDDAVFWIEEVLDEASDIYGDRNGVDAGIADARSTSEFYDAYVLENRAVGQKIFGFEVRPLRSGDFGTGFSMRPEGESDEYDDFRDAVYEAFESDVGSF